MLTDDLPGTGGRIKERPEDFLVEEIPAYLPSGEGDHVMIKVRKRGVTTDEVARALARAGDVRPGDVGFAGRKDKQAVTVQWFSTPAKKEPEFFEELEGEGFEVLEASRHRNKLRTGHLRGNRFTVVIRGVGADALDLATPVRDRILAEGLPNTFGPQRFGRGGSNAGQTLAWVRGKGRLPKDRRQRKLLISSLQALLFNRAVHGRLERGLFTSALRGDLAKVRASGGMFVVEDPEEVTGRIRRGEVSPTGPIYGSKMWWPEADALGFEEAVLGEAGMTRADLERFQRDGRGSRRPIRVFPEGLAMVHEGDTLTLEFGLESGAFATTLVAEITKSEELRCPMTLELE